MKKRNRLILIVGGIIGLCLTCVAFGAILDITTPETEEATPTEVVAQAEASTPTIAPSETPLPTATLEPTFTSTPEFALPAVADCVPTNTEVTQAKVTRVIDGDTIEVDVDGQLYKIRYIGMDTPESTKTLEYFGKEATAENKRLVAGKTIIMVKDVSETDQYDRLLRYVFVGDTFVNLKLVENGFATAATYPPDVACADTFVAYEDSARNNGVGLWGPTPTPKPTYTPKPRPTSTPSRPSRRRSPTAIPAIRPYVSRLNPQTWIARISHTSGSRYCPRIRTTLMAMAMG
jgi:endonuclease YncB( thermonuclease family)